MPASPLIGEAACLGATLCWAVAVSLFRRPIVEHGPWAVNLAKILIAAVLLGVTTIAVGQGGVLIHGPRRGLALVALSGVVGLTLGDTALFAAVRRVGVHQPLLLQTLAPVFAALLAIGFYGERLRPTDVIGAVVILAGVALVVAPKKAERTRRFDLLGLALGVLAAFGQGAGVVVAKAGMDEVPIVASTVVRLVGAAVGMVVVMYFWGELGAAARTLTAVRTLRQVLLPTIIGTYLALILMMAGIALAPATVAAVLMSTTPIFSLFVDARFEGTPITLRGLGGTVLAVIGVGVLVAGN